MSQIYLSKFLNTSLLSRIRSITAYLVDLGRVALYKVFYEGTCLAKVVSESTWADFQNVVTRVGLAQRFEELSVMHITTQKHNSTFAESVN